MATFGYRSDFMSMAHNPHTELNSIQVSLFRLFNRPMSEEESLKLKRLLVNHYAGALNEEIKKVVAEKNYTQRDFDDMLNSNS
ncbi:MAG: hypothetical protein BroJett042_03840 [Bacteroidota bacterium]|nr:MAG: hypothetical protein BroJett042_03840 [Bacteroidota bacterium]